MKNRLTIAVQKKGRLFDQSIDLIKKSGINFSTKGDNLLAKSNNLPIDILFVRSDDIPSLVSNGDADLAIVGENVLLEKSLFKRTYIDKVLNLGFSRCRLSFACPENINIKFNQDLKIEVFSIFGKKLIHTKINQTNSILDISTLSKGVYFIKVSHKGLSLSTKIIKI